MPFKIFAMLIGSVIIAAGLTIWVAALVGPWTFGPIAAVLLLAAALVLRLRNG